MRKTYPSDISRGQFEQVKGLLETARKKTRPRTVDLYDVFCAILYLLRGATPGRVSESLTSALVDGGYTGQPFAESIRDLIGATVQAAKRSKLHTAVGSSNALSRGWRNAVGSEKHRAFVQHEPAIRHKAFLALLLRRY